MKYIFEVWKGHVIYHDTLSGLFYTELGYSSYVLSGCRYAAVNNIH